MLKKRLILLIALLLGLFSALMVYRYLQQGSGMVNEQELVPIVVAAKDIQPKERITADQVEVKKVPREMAHYEATARLDQVVGFFAKDGILSGEQILGPKLIKGFEDYGIVIKIPVGYRAMTVPVDQVVSVAGFIRPGDYVDVVAGFNEMIMGENIARVILQNVLVLATDQDLSEDKRDPVVELKTVTVAVTLDEAERLALALDQGKVRIVLRPIESKEVEPTNPVTAAKLLEEMKKDQPKTAIRPVSKSTTRKTTTTTSRTQPAQPSAVIQPKPVPITQSSSQVTVTEEVKEEIYVVEVIRGTKRETVSLDQEAAGEIEAGKEGENQ